MDEKKAASELWTILTNVTGAYPWVWPVVIGSWALSRALRAFWPQIPPEPIVLRDAEIVRLRALCTGAGVDAGPVIEFPGAALRPPWASALISIVSPITTTFDAVLWALSYLVKAILKRITGQDVPDGTGTGLRLRNGD